MNFNIDKGDKSGPIRKDFISPKELPIGTRVVCLVSRTSENHEFIKDGLHYHGWIEIDGIISKKKGKRVVILNNMLLELWEDPLSFEEDYQLVNSIGYPINHIIEIIKMNYITHEEKRNAFGHYWFMRKWVKTQNPKDPVLAYLMKEAIGETWKSRYCNLCLKYNTEDRDMCRNCPLYLSGYGCNEKNSQWAKVHTSYDWEEWLVEVEKMMRIILSLKEKE